MDHPVAHEPVVGGEVELGRRDRVRAVADVPAGELGRQLADDRQVDVEAIYFDGFESFDRHASAALVDGLAAGARAYREWALANPMHYLVMWGRAVPDFTPSPQAARRAYQSFLHLVEAVRLGGAEHPLPEAYHAWATLHGYVMLELAGLGLATTEQYNALYERAIASIEPNGAG